MEKNNSSVCVVYYSPTHTSGKIAKAIAEGLAAETCQLIDLTTDNRTEPIYVQADWLILAAPVYGGRIPVSAMERFKRLKMTRTDGAPTKAVVAVVYGNRDYDDALLELCNEAEALGFPPVAGGAFIGEHSFSRPEMPTAQNRPDANDLQIARHFRTAGCRMCRSCKYRLQAARKRKHALPRTHADTTGMPRQHRPVQRLRKMCKTLSRTRHHPYRR